MVSTVRVELFVFDSFELVGFLDLVSFEPSGFRFLGLMFGSALWLCLVQEGANDQQLESSSSAVCVAMSSNGQPILTDLTGRSVLLV